MPLTALTGLRGYCFSSPSTMMMVSRDRWTAEGAAVVCSELMVCDFPFAPEYIWKRPLICKDTGYRIRDSGKKRRGDKQGGCRHFLFPSSILNPVSCS